MIAAACGMSGWVSRPFVRAWRGQAGFIGYAELICFERFSREPRAQKSCAVLRLGMRRNVRVHDDLLQGERCRNIALNLANGFGFSAVVQDHRREEHHAHCHIGVE